MNLVAPNPPPSTGDGTGGHRITLNIPTKGRSCTARRGAAPKRKATIKIEPLRGSNVPKGQGSNSPQHGSMRARTNPPQPSVHMSGGLSGPRGTIKVHLKRGTRSVQIGVRYHLDYQLGRQGTHTRPTTFRHCKMPREKATPQPKTASPHNKLK